MISSQLDFESFIQAFIQGPVISCSLAASSSTCSVEIISNSRIYYCETCLLNFKSEAKKRSHIHKNKCIRGNKGE